MAQQSPRSQSKPLLDPFYGVILSVLLLGILNSSQAGDWATYRADAARSGVSPETIGHELFLQWKYLPAHAPKPAWPMPGEELPRMHNDNAYHAVVAEGNVYFGSSATNKVYAIDAAQGEIRWTFSTQGPVRFVPTVYAGKVYVGSDDGYVYCLDAEEGSLVWKYRAGPSEEKVIGNGRMISLWPVRTGILVDRGIVYFAAGVFPYEGLYICALEAGDGQVVWRNDTIGDRAHELQYGGISPHGYLLATNDILYVPSGRSMPVAFDRQTGEFLFTISPGGKRGGTWALLDRDRLVSGVDASGTPFKVAYDAKTGEETEEVFTWFPGLDMVMTRESSYVVTRQGIYAINRAKYASAAKTASQQADTQKKMNDLLVRMKGELDSATDEFREVINQQIDQMEQRIAAVREAEVERLKSTTCDWHYPTEGLASLIVAGGVLFAGGQDTVVGIEIKTGKEIWKRDVEGRAVGLVAGNGCLVVSTDEGPVYCFSSTNVTVSKEIDERSKTNPFPADALTQTYRSAAEKFLSESGAQKGYCLVLDCAEGRLAYELAKMTELQIVCLEQDPAKLEKARRNMAQAGLLGSRVIVEPWDIESLPDYFANLIVSDDLLIGGNTAVAQEEMFRVLQPYGGVTYLSFSGESKATVQKVVRGPLPGAGSWVQQFGNPQNTACSGDDLVNGPLGILWYGEPGPQRVVERHAEAQSPVCLNGRLYIEGEELITAVDAYNGTVLWKREIPGAVRVKIKADSGNLVVTEDGLFVAAFGQCLRLDLKTGRTIRVYEMPPSDDGEPRRWGYISAVGNVLYGSTAKAMNEEYGALWNAFIQDDHWKPIEEVSEKYRKKYSDYLKRYPNPEDLSRDFQRRGRMFRTMTAFGFGGEFTQKNAVTDSLMTCDKIFALDIDTGKQLWVHEGEHIANIAITLGDGKIFFADRTASQEQRELALKDKAKLAQSGVYHERADAPKELKEKQQELAEFSEEKSSYSKRQLTYLVDSLKSEFFVEDVADGALTRADADVRVVYALEAETGVVCWQRPVELTGCCGDRMGASYSDGMLFFFGNYGNHDAWRFRVGGLKWRRITALSGDNGDMVWSRPLNYRTRPVIIDDQIILEPQACDLHTGEIIMRTHPVTGEQVPWEFLRPGHTCGLTAASTNGLFYRSASTAFYDLAEDRGVTTFGGYRPGCALSVIPASGVLLSPEAAAGCTCSYPIRCSVALTRKVNRAQPWTVYVTPGDMRPVKHFAINLGASADMKDKEGTVWFGYPNPRTESFNHFANYGIKFDLQDEFMAGTGYFRRDFKGLDIDGTDKPWLFTSGCLGFQRCVVPLIDPNSEDGPGMYTVRLGFKASVGDQPGKRIFDIKLQGQIVSKDFDICQATGDCNMALIEEFKGIEVENDLVLELVPRTSLELDRVPLINFIEVVRTKEPETAKLGQKKLTQPG